VASGDILRIQIRFGRIFLYRSGIEWTGSRFTFPRTALFIQSITRSTWPRHRAIAGLLSFFVVFQLSQIQGPRDKIDIKTFCVHRVPRTAYKKRKKKRKLAQFNRDVFLDVKIERENL